MRRIVRLGLVLAAALAIGGATAMSAAADGGGKRFDSKLVGLPASMTTQSLFGVPPGGLPWRLDEGRATLSSDGRLRVEVDHLVLAAGAREGTNPIAHAAAVVTCGGVRAATSKIVPFSVPGGDAEIRDTVSLPHPCVAPAVFVVGVPNVNADPTTFPWFAVTGL
jgi:hypothetical protein